MNPGQLRLSVFLTLLLLLFIPVQAGLLDRVKSPSGVYAYEEKVSVYRIDFEEIDVRSDKTFVWKSVMRLQAPDTLPMENTSFVRGRWKSSFGNVSFSIGENDSVYREFTIDDGDLIEKSGLKRRFTKKK